MPLLKRIKCQCKLPGKHPKYQFRMSYLKINLLCHAQPPPPSRRGCPGTHRSYAGLSTSSLGDWGAAEDPNQLLPQLESSSTALPASTATGESALGSLRRLNSTSAFSRLRGHLCWRYPHQSPFVLCFLESSSFQMDGREAKPGQYKR